MLKREWLTDSIHRLLITVHMGIKIIYGIFS